MADGPISGGSAHLRGALGRGPRWDSRRRPDAPADSDVTGANVATQAPSAPEKVNLAHQLARFSEHEAPQVLGEFNGQPVRLARLLGSLGWHHHEETDALYLVVRGRLRLEFHERSVELSEGECLIVPRGVAHRPVADEEAHVLLFAPASTLPGGASEQRTAQPLGRL